MNYERATFLGRREVPLMVAVRREAAVIEVERRQRLDELRDLLASGRGDFRQMSQWREEIIQLHERGFRV